MNKNKDLLLALIAKILNSSGLFIFAMLTARILNTSDFALLNVKQNYINILVVILSIGMSYSLIYFGTISLFRAKYYLAIMNTTIGFLLVTLLSISCFNKYLDKYVIVISISQILFSGQQALHQSKLQFSKSNNLQLLQTISLISLTCIYLYYYDGNDLDIVLSILAFSYLFAIRKLYILKIRNIFFLITRLNYKLIEFYKYGSKSILLNVLGILFYTIDILLLGVFEQYEYLAIYSVAVLFTKIIWLVGDSLGTSLFPRLIGDVKNKQLYKSYANKIMASTSIISLIIFYILGDNLVRAFFGGEFINSYNICLILLLGSFPINYYKFYSRYFAAENKWAIIYIILIITVILQGTLISISLLNGGLNYIPMIMVSAYWFSCFLIWKNI